MLYLVTMTVEVEAESVEAAAEVGADMILDGDVNGTVYLEVHDGDEVHLVEVQL